MVQIESMWSMVSRIKAGTLDTTPPKKALTLQQTVNLARKHKLGPVVVFLEGTASNGRAILRCNPVFSQFKDPTTLTHIRYLRHNVLTIA
jgi:hypothetical protein